MAAGWLFVLTGAIVRVIAMKQSWPIKNIIIIHHRDHHRIIDSIWTAKLINLSASACLADLNSFNK